MGMVVTFTEQWTRCPRLRGHAGQMNESRRNAGSFLQAAQILGEMKMGGGVGLVHN